MTEPYAACPFCGAVGGALSVEDRGSMGERAVYCDNCHAWGPFSDPLWVDDPMEQTTEQDALAVVLWNRRWTEDDAARTWMRQACAQLANTLVTRMPHGGDFAESERLLKSCPLPRDEAEP